MLTHKILELVKKGYSVEFAPAPVPQNKGDRAFTLRMRNSNSGNAIVVSKNFAMAPKPLYEVEDRTEVIVGYLLDETEADIISIAANIELGKKS